MKNSSNLLKVEIPNEFINKTSFLFEVKDEEFLHLGIQPNSIVLVDNSKRLSFTLPVALFLNHQAFVGYVLNVSDESYRIENIGPLNRKLEFKLNEVQIIGCVRGFFVGRELVFEYLKEID